MNITEFQKGFLKSKQNEERKNKEREFNSFIQPFTMEEFTQYFYEKFHILLTILMIIITISLCNYYMFYMAVKYFFLSILFAGLTPILFGIFWFLVVNHNIPIKYIRSQNKKLNDAYSKFSSIYERLEIEEKSLTVKDPVSNLSVNLSDRRDFYKFIKKIN